MGTADLLGVLGLTGLSAEVYMCSGGVSDHNHFMELAELGG